jgi:hypothetical protein
MSMAGIAHIEVASFGSGFAPHFLRIEIRDFSGENRDSWDVGKFEVVMWLIKSRKFFVFVRYIVFWTTLKN